MARGKRRMRGITLIELMIVVVCVGILAAIAYPSYMNQVRKAKRADGKAQLMETAQALERCYTRFGRYNDAGCDVVLPVMSDENHYQIQAAALTAATFTLNAVPQGPQTEDTECATLTLSHTGAQGSTGSADSEECW
jgi:type IV pilus assembly protein PilE